MLKQGALMPAAPAPTAKTRAGRAVKYVGGLALLASIALVVLHVFQWLRDAIWPSYPAAALLVDLGLPAPAGQGVIAWTLAWSAAGLLFGLGIGFVFLGACLTETHDSANEAAAASRGKFRQATERERSASWARGSRARPAALAQAAERTVSPPSPPRSFGRAVVDNVLGLGAVVLFFAGAVGLLIGWDYFDRTRYNRISARVASVDTRCVLEWPPPRDPGWGESASARRTEAMPCVEARPRARGDQPRLIEVRTVAYSYTSPRDGRTYSGTIHADAVDLPADVRAGGEMIVYALKADPSRSRGIYGWPVD